MLQPCFPLQLAVSDLSLTNSTTVSSEAASTVYITKSSCRCRRRRKARCVRVTRTRLSCQSCDARRRSNASHLETPTRELATSLALPSWHAQAKSKKAPAYQTSPELLEPFGFTARCICKLICYRQPCLRVVCFCTDDHTWDPQLLILLQLAGG